MRRWIAMALLGALLAGCGGGSERATTINPPSQAAATAASNPPAPTAAGSPVAASPTVGATAVAGALGTTVDLTKALLTLDDMPTGWTTGKPSSGSDRKLCDREIFGVDPVAKSGADFERGLAAVTQGAGAFKRGEAAPAMERARKALEGCTEWTETGSDGKPTTYRIRPLSFPKLGDETLAFRLSLSASGVVAEADAVYIRRGDFITYLANIQGGLGIATVDSALTEQLARKADQKLAAVAGR